MGTKVQLDNYLPGYCSTRDLNHDSDGTSWTLVYGENNLSNGQCYYSHLPRTSVDSSPGANKDVLKQTMLKHEAIFKNQVSELHRLYRVQKDLMHEIQRNEQYKHRMPNGASSSSLLASQITPDDAHRRNSSSFLFTNSGCEGPPVSELIQSSAGSSLKGNSIQMSSIPLHRCGSPKGSEVSESRPTNLRKMIDLHLPADEYVDSDEEEQRGNGAAFDSREKLFPSRCGKTEYQKDASRFGSCLRRPGGLADLNEPVQSEETNVYPSVNFLGAQNLDDLTIVPVLSKDVSSNSKHGNMHGTLNDFQYNSKGNGHHWFSSVLKGDRNKDNWISIHQPNHPGTASMSTSPLKNSHQPTGLFPHHPKEDDAWPEKINGDLKTFDRSPSFSSYSNREAVLASQLPSYAPSSDLANSWNHSWGKPNSYLSQKSFPVQASPYLSSASLSKSPQSPLQSGEVLGNGWHMNKHPSSNPGFVGESSVQNGFYQGPSSGFKEFPAHFRNAASDYVNGSCSDKANSGSSNFLKGSNSLDLNSARDVNLNMVLPNCPSNEPLAKEGVKIVDSEVKREGPLSVLPWLRSKGGASINEAVSSRSVLDKQESGLFRGPHELSKRDEVGNMLDHQNCVTSTCDLDARRTKGHTINDYPSSSRKILGVPIFQKPTFGEEEIKSGSRKGLLDINVPCDPENFDAAAAAASETIVREEKTETGRSTGLQNMIDLNSCVVEDEIPSRTIVTNSSPTANSWKLAGGAIIDLEAPIDLGSEEENLIPGKQLSMKQNQNSTDTTDEELARVAAEAIVAISSCARPVEEASGLEDTLHWFADVVCSCPDDNWDFLSGESDSFEEMTLKLTECTFEEYNVHFSSPSVTDILKVEEPSPVTVMGRTRRFPPRKGRQRKDFQRDILPGLSSLARHEVTEDLQKFGGLMRATGLAWQGGSQRNASRSSSRGRRRRVVAAAAAAAATTTTTTTTASEKQKQLTKDGEIMVEDRSLTGWGKTTRRPRRQRCPPAEGNLAPVVLT